MRRREFIVLVSGAAAAWPPFARGQQDDRVRRVGFLSGRADDPLSVVDAAGRVHGVPGLRVIDASIMPTVPNERPW